MTGDTDAGAEIDYPDLFDTAERRSARAQSIHFGLVIVEYTVLVGTALMALIDGIEQVAIPNTAYVVSFVILLLVASATHFSGFDKVWFRSRAAAEAVKALSWRFMMRAPPLHRDNAETIFDTKAKFITEFDPKLKKMPCTDIVTGAMKSIRNEDMAARYAIYMRDRVRDQLDWYEAKSKSNKDRALRWYLSVLGVYAVPLILIPTGIIDASEQWPVISLFLLVGSSFLGWTKARRYHELSLAYGETAKEIRSLTEADPPGSDADLASFVDMTENAFLREHTAWIINKK